MRHIVILAHPLDDFARAGYLLQGVADLWRQAGNKVSVVRDPLRHLDADLAILHVDLTVVPDEFLRFMTRYPLAINARVRDISKRAFSTNIVRDGDGYKGPVIVKTDLNCGGANEALHARESWLQRRIRAVRRRMHWSWRSELHDYSVFDSPGRVPLPAWFNPDLVIERFLPERHDGYFCMRNWRFLGDAEECRIYYCKEPVVKTRLAVRIEKSEIPDELREIRRKLGFDFGKFDFGVVDGHVVLYDVNRTPVATPDCDNNALFRLLASGIDSFFKPRYRAAS
jgi:hypothetical protein